MYAPTWPTDLRVWVHVQAHVLGRHVHVCIDITYIVARVHAYTAQLLFGELRHFGGAFVSALALGACRRFTGIGGVHMLGCVREVRGEVDLLGELERRTCMGLRQLLECDLHDLS